MDAPSLVVVRNEVDPDSTYHCDALASYFPDARELDYPAGDRPDLDRVDGVVLTGSTAGVYETDDHPWMDDQRALVRELVDRNIPTLGVCFGHQIVNDALGGTVEHVGMRAGLVEADLADDPLLEGVSPIVPGIHGDVVTEPGDGMDVIASADYYSTFGTRHRRAPLWTVQFHPEIGPEHRDLLAVRHGWTNGEDAFADANAPRVFENFEAIVARSIERADRR